MKPITVSLIVAATLLLLVITAQRAGGAPVPTHRVRHRRTERSAGAAGGDTQTLQDGASRKRREAMFSQPENQMMFNSVRGIVSEAMPGMSANLLS